MKTTEIDNLGIPPLGGVCTYEEACRTGYDVEHGVGLLKRYAYVESRLVKVFAAHLACTPQWEVKCAFGLHMWLDAEHGNALRRRVSEMREPPLRLDAVPDERLEAWLEEVIRAGDATELLVGLYRVVKPELVRAMERHLAESNPLVDHPTWRTLRSILREEEEMVAWGEQAIEALTTDPTRAKAARAWEDHLRVFLRAAAGITGDEDLTRDTDLPEPRWIGGSYEMCTVPRRDDRFKDSFNSSADIDEYYKEEERPLDERVMALSCKRLQEMDVPEWMAPIIYETQDKPWEYYADLSRHLWDETRHAMLGEVALFAKGVPFYKYPVNASASHVLNTRFSPREAHTMLWGIEQELMPRRTGKGYEWDLAAASGDDLAALIQDYDWADEILHAQIGRKWLLPEVDSRALLKATSHELLERFEEYRAELDARSEQAEWWTTLMSDVSENREKSETSP